MMSQAKAPGKLYIAGEYAVVQPGHLAIVAAISETITVTIKTTRHSIGHIYSTQNPEIALRWSHHPEGLQVHHPEDLYPHITQCMAVAHTYLQSLSLPATTVYDLSVTSGLDDADSGQKYGLGSSGAVMIATLKAILQLHGVSYTPLLLYQLAAIAHQQLGLNGSMGDLAASAFGGFIAYSSVDQVWLNQQLHTVPLQSLLASDWPQLQLTPLNIPAELSLLVGWTQSPASTAAYVQSVTSSRSQAQKEAYYQTFLTESQACVQQAITACHAQDAPAFEAAIRTNHALLQTFAREMEIAIETPALSQLCAIAQAHGAAAKSSGAGGGDCGICFTTSASQRRQIRMDWQAAGILPLPLYVIDPLSE